MKPFTGEEGGGGGGHPKAVTFGGKRRFYAEEVCRKKPRIGDESSSSSSFSSCQEDDTLQSSFSSTSSVKKNRGLGIGFLPQGSADDEVSIFDDIPVVVLDDGDSFQFWAEFDDDQHFLGGHDEPSFSPVEARDDDQEDDDCSCTGDNFDMLRQQQINVEEKKKRRLTQLANPGHVEACVCPTFFQQYCFNVDVPSDQELLRSAEYKLKADDDEFGDAHFWNSFTDITHV